MRAGHLVMATAALLVGLAAGPGVADAVGTSSSGKPGKQTGTAKKTTAARTAPRKKASGELRRKPAARKVAAASAAPAAAPETVSSAPKPSSERRLTRDQRFRAARAGAKSAL